MFIYTFKANIFKNGTTQKANENDIIQENSYYPFGMAHVQPYAYATQGLENKYQYNGKELNGDFGLDWYAYGFRYYDASIGRFTGVDPIASDFAFVSEYNYAENEPVRHIDLHGLQKFDLMGLHDPNFAHSFNAGGMAQVKEDRAVFDRAFTQGIVGGGSLMGAGFVGAARLGFSTKSMGLSLGFEGIASLVTQGDFSKVDLADATLSGLTGSFWLGNIGGSVLDITLDGEHQSAFGLIGDKKALRDIGIDAGVGVLGLKLEGSMVRAGGHFAAESKIMMKHVSEVSAGRASGLAQSSIKHGSNQDFKHLADREYMANRVAFFGELLSKSATHTKSGITPIIQKELTDGD